MRGKPEQAGFTLLETIIVLVVLGLAAGIVVSRGSMHSPTVELRSIATGMLQGLRATRAEAIAGNHDTAFSLDVGRHAYRGGGGAAQALPRAVAVAMSVGGKPARAIVFSPDGSSTGGRIELAEASRRMSVSVDWLSGRMRVWDTTP